MRRRAGIAGVSLLLGLVLLPLPATNALAADTCRQAARDLSSAVNATTSVDGAVLVFQQALVLRPDCRSEFQTLAEWYDGGGIGPYPFKAEDDPAKGFLGPIGWWWNTIYVSMFGRSAVLMFLFGWELFLIPIVMVTSVAAGLISSILPNSRK